MKQIATLILLLELYALLPVIHCSSESCPENAEECSFTLVITSKLTMMNENGKRLVKPKNGQLYDISDLNTPLDNGKEFTLLFILIIL